jgi:hypothetical protein
VDDPDEIVADPGERRSRRSHVPFLPDRDGRDHPDFWDGDTPGAVARWTATPTTEERTGMPTTRAEKPQDLLPIIEDAINRADLDAFLAAHDGKATVLVP